MLYYIYNQDLPQYVIDTDTFNTCSLEEAKAIFNRKKIAGYNSKAYIITALRMDNYLLILRNHLEPGVLGINEELYVRGRCLFKASNDKHIQNVMVLSNGDSIVELGKGYRWVTEHEYYYVSYNAKSNRYTIKDYLVKVWKYLDKYKEKDNRAALYKKYFETDTDKLEGRTGQDYVVRQFQEDWFLTDMKDTASGEYILTLMNGYTGEVITIDGDEMIHNPISEAYVHKMKNMEKLINPIYFDKLDKKVKYLTHQITYIYSYFKKDIVFKFGLSTQGWLRATVDIINLYIRQYCSEEIEWLRKKLSVAIVVPIYNELYGTIDLGFVTHSDLYCFYLKINRYNSFSNIRYRSLIKDGKIEY